MGSPALPVLLSPPLTQLTAQLHKPCVCLRQGGGSEHLGMRGEEESYQPSH